jgi:hypothetical protein
MARRSSIGMLDRFAKVKRMPAVGRVSGGGVRAVYYRHPGRVRVFRGKRVNGTRSATYDSGD